MNCVIKQFLTPIREINQTSWKQPSTVAFLVFFNCTLVLKTIKQKTVQRNKYSNIQL